MHVVHRSSLRSVLITFDCYYHSKNKDTKETLRRRQQRELIHGCGEIRVPTALVQYKAEKLIDPKKPINHGATPK